MILGARALVLHTLTSPLMLSDFSLSLFFMRCVFYASHHHHHRRSIVVVVDGVVVAAAAVDAVMRLLLSIFACYNASILLFVSRLLFIRFFRQAELSLSTERAQFVVVVLFYLIYMLVFRLALNCRPFHMFRHIHVYMKIQLTQKHKR